ncbi:MAG TPA: TauD/TfdA family dioxygenase [Ktedonobacteraceae bacterium]|nr:TauD/TfdA family dioxygenase [Ktedonobacteraceae bacterium]
MERPQPSPGKSPIGKRKAVSTRQDFSMVKVEQLFPEQPLPLLIRPAVPGLDLIAWASQNKDALQQLLLQHGGLLLRNFPVETVAQFEQLMIAITEKQVDYQERTSPRTQVSGTIYTSTDYPAGETILLHNEQSYAITWPLKVAFYCLIPPEQGGETPIADCRKVLQHIAPEIRERFLRKKYMYVRNFHERLGLSWQVAFQTSERAAIESYCREHAIEYEWLAGNQLRTRQVRPAIVNHPLTGEQVWFNHIAFFHSSLLVPHSREYLLKEFGEQDLPNNTYYGDGSPIEPEVVHQIHQAYEQETIRFPWQRTDVLLLDNILTAHGRAPFSGPRKILVNIADPYNSHSA